VRKNFYPNFNIDFSFVYFNSDLSEFYEVEIGLLQLYNQTGQSKASVRTFMPLPTS
jgi:long-subunit fatty acid transport protein